MRRGLWMAGVGVLAAAGAAVAVGSSVPPAPGPEPEAVARSASTGVTRTPQRGSRRSPQQGEVSNATYDGRFTFARLRFESQLTARGFGYSRGQPPWAHDYPRAERNLMRILDEVSLLGPYLDGGNIYDLDDPGLMKHPVAYLSEPGYWDMNDEEVRGLREYLLKGGFVIFDDFRGGGEWANFRNQMRRVLPDARLMRLDVSHPIFHSFFDVESLDFRGPNFGFLDPGYYGIFEENDPEKRLMVVANHNNDIGDYWEWSDTDFLPIELSNEAYKLGVNYIMYALTH